MILACASSARKRIGRSRVPVAVSAPLVAYLATYAATARSVRSWPVAEVGRADRTDVELSAEDEGVRPAVDLRAVDASGSGGSADGVGQQLGRRPGRGRGLTAFRAVEADDRVEVDGATLLVLGHLGEGDPGMVAEGPLGEAGLLGDFPATRPRHTAARSAASRRSTTNATRQHGSLSDHRRSWTPTTHCPDSTSSTVRPEPAESPTRRSATSPRPCTSAAPSATSYAGSSSAADRASTTPRCGASEHERVRQRPRPGQHSRRSRI